MRGRLKGLTNGTMATECQSKTTLGKGGHAMHGQPLMAGSSTQCCL